MTSPGDACRNCGAAAPGNYCPQCGQETNLALPSAYGVVSLKVVYRGRWGGAIARVAMTGILYSFLFLLAVVALMMAAVALR
ncbi:MAG: hypothetical protein ACYC9Z_11550 [Casimicrobiaceae bacterium]